MHVEFYAILDKPNTSSELARPGAGACTPGGLGHAQKLSNMKPRFTNRSEKKQVVDRACSKKKKAAYPVKNSSQMMLK